MGTTKAPSNQRQSAATSSPSERLGGGRGVVGAQTGVPHVPDATPSPSPTLIGAVKVPVQSAHGRRRAG